MMDWETWHDAQETLPLTVEDGSETHTFDVRYYEHGHGDPVTIFVHGLPTWGYLWRDVLDAVDHAVVPDLPGFGFTRHTSEQPSYSRSVRFLELFLEAFITELGLENLNVVAHDWGGAAVLRYAIHNPGIFEKLVLSMIVWYDNFPLENIHSLGLPRSAKENRHLWGDVTDESLNEELDYIFVNSTYDDDRATGTFVAGMKAPWLEHPDPTRLHKAAASANANNTLELTHRHHNVNIPVRLVWAEDDRIIPVEYGERLHEDLPNADLVTIDEAYHWLMQDRPQAFADAVHSFFAEST